MNARTPTPTTAIPRPPVTQAMPWASVVGLEQPSSGLPPMRVRAAPRRTASRSGRLHTQRTPVTERSVRWVITMLMCGLFGALFGFAVGFTNGWAVADRPNIQFTHPAPSHTKAPVTKAPKPKATVKVTGG